MLELGTAAPPFSLPDTVSGKPVRLEDIEAERALVVMFICNHCPYVIHVKPEIARIAREYAKKGVGFVAISSNDVEQYPEDGPEEMKAFAGEAGFDFPYLYDASQQVAKAYSAACTPDFYVFDSGHKLVYRGRIAASRPKNDEPLTGADLRAALNALLEDRHVPGKQYPSVGCNIKWKE